jgi:hypothetical protein
VATRPDPLGKYSNKSLSFRGLVAYQCRQILQNFSKEVIVNVNLFT